MKKLFAFAMLIFSMSSSMLAQNQLKTYSVYDVNRKDGVTVADATMVVNRAIESIQEDPQVVDATVLNSILQSIDERLQKLEVIETRLAAIEAKLGIEVPNDDPYNGHEYVDLGLPSGLKWATCNIGADKPEGYGLYFAWGETVGYGQDTSDGHSFDWTNYKWCNGDYNNLTKYCDDSFYGNVDNKIILDLEDDAAHVNWGGSWRMPTGAEQAELCNNCTWQWEVQNGVNGYKITGINGNWIFLPAANYRVDLDLWGENEHGRYWSSTYLQGGYANSAFGLSFNVNGYSPFNNNSRYSGCSIRPVIK